MPRYQGALAVNKRFLKSEGAPQLTQNSGYGGPVDSSKNTWGRDTLGVDEDIVEGAHDGIPTYSSTTTAQVLPGHRSRGEGLGRKENTGRKRPEASHANQHV